MDFKYKINGIEFEQKELTFEEDGVLFEIIKEKIPNLGISPETTILKSLEDILTSGIVIPFLKIVLKPKKNIRNYLIKKYLKLKSYEDVFPKIPNSVLVSVIQDFFLKNLKWTESFMNSKQG